MNEEVRRLLQADESENVEFKEAKTQFNFNKLGEYCAAMANERGGKVVLGVSDGLPRHVVGTDAFPSVPDVKRDLLVELSLRVDVREISCPEGRVLVFEVPSRPIGQPVRWKAKYLMRSGESLVPMTPETLNAILAEGQPDYSGVVCSAASMADLADAAIDAFRRQWLRKSRNRSYESLPTEQLLSDAELLVDGKVTHAALILLGTHQALGRCLPHAEVIYEFRSAEEAIHPQVRREFRQGFLTWYDELWQLIDARNDLQEFRDGLFRRDIPMFDHDVIREAILNAVCHRDYRLQDSVFIRQSPKQMEIVSPGGFIGGVTPENILRRQAWRNRRLAEAFQKCGLVERSGQGADRMFEKSIREGKATPDYSNSDEHRVSLLIQGEVQDVRFLRFLENVAEQALAPFGVEDLLVLDMLRRGREVPAPLKHRLVNLRECGVVERVGKGRGARYILSRKLYGFLGEEGKYTRHKGLDRRTNKELLLKHIREYRADGSKLRELMQVLPDLKRSQVQTLLQEMKAEGKVQLKGRTRGARWYPVIEAG